MPCDLSWSLSLPAGTIAGAALDVTVEEPLAAESALWGMEHVVITSHTAGETDLYEARLVDIVVRVAVGGAMLLHPPAASLHPSSRFAQAQLSLHGARGTGHGQQAGCTCRCPRPFRSLGCMGDGDGISVQVENLGRWERGEPFVHRIC